MRKKEWNPSVYIPNSFDHELDHKKKLLDIRIGLQNHKNTIFKEKKIEKGCDIRKDFFGWNVSNYIEKNQLKENFDQINKKAFNNTLKKENILLTNYVRPINHQKEYMNYLRHEKIENKDLINKLREKYVYDYPDATEEKILGGFIDYLKNINIKNSKKIILIINN